MDKNRAFTGVDTHEKKDRVGMAKASMHEARYSAFIENAVEGIWRIDFDPPIRLDVPKSDQVIQIFDRGIFTEANDAAAQIYGLTKGEEVVGRPIADFMSQSVAKNVETLAEFVQNSFCMRNLVSREQNVGGQTLSAVNNVTPYIEDGKVLYIWGASLDISDLLVLEEKLEKSRNDLAMQKQALEEKNVALKELITFIELDKKEFKERIIANIDQVVLPILDKISLSHTGDIQIDQLRQALQGLTSSFGVKMANRRVNLTPREVEVCTLVKNGLTSKEISRALNIALHTVEKHRRMARKKMGLTRKGINLQTHLNSF